VSKIPFNDERMNFYNEGAPQFSPINDSLLAFQFEYDVENADYEKYVSILNWRTDSLLKIYSDVEYTAPRWTPAGDLLMWDREGGVYIVRANGEVFGEPEFLFKLPEAIIDPAISHDGTRMVFSMARHIWLCNLDGSNLTQLTAPGLDGFEQNPIWSPDDRYIVFKSSMDGERDGDLWVVASDAENIRIRKQTNSAIRLLDNEQKNLNHIYGSLIWRYF
jgi:Tol biopolymer transport system component